MMVAELRPSHPPAHLPRRSRSKSRQPSYALDIDALCVTIRSLWSKERRLGAYSPTDELCLDLETLDIEALRGLRAQIRARIEARLTAATPN